MEQGSNFSSTDPSKLAPVVEDGAGYVAPRIQTFSPDEFLDLLGPAQGYGGGNDGSGSGDQPTGRTPRLFPGSR